MLECCRNQSYFWAALSTKMGLSIFFICSICTGCAGASQDEMYVPWQVLWPCSPWLCNCKPCWSSTCEVSTPTTRLIFRDILPLSNTEDGCCSHWALNCPTQETDWSPRLIPQPSDGAWSQHCYNDRTFFSRIRHFHLALATAKIQIYWNAAWRSSSAAVSCHQSPSKVLSNNHSPTKALQLLIVTLLDSKNRQKQIQLECLPGVFICTARMKQLPLQSLQTQRLRDSGSKEKLNNSTSQWCLILLSHLSSSCLIPFMFTKVCEAHWSGWG